MLSFAARLLLTATSIAPVSLTYSWVAFYQGQQLIAAIALAIAGGALCLCLLLLRHVRKNAEILRFETSSIEPADAENIGFMLLYLFPLFTDRIGDLNCELWIPILGIFAVVVGTGYGYHFNPLLGLLKWHFYKVTSKEGVSYVLITKKHLRTARAVHRVGQLTEYILIDLEDR
jgi:hypothetical protein